MKRAIHIAKVIVIALAMWVTTVFSAPDPMVEIRVGGIVGRGTDGAIRRSQAVVRAFRKQWACPATGQTSGPCPGWAVDHVIPLACGGVDAIYNMQWLPLELKSAADNGAKDRFERKVYRNSMAGRGCE